jgi:hypothetical protein
MIERWRFYDEVSGQHWWIDYPKQDERYRGWQREYHADGRVKMEGPKVEVKRGLTLVGQRIRATQDVTVKCATGCKRATGVSCTCSCGGKNHGIWCHGPDAIVKDDETDSDLDI